MFRLLLVLMMAGLSIPAAALDSVTRETLTSGGKAREYFLFVPDSVKTDTPAPLLILLHGSGRDGKTLVDPWRDVARKEGIILAGPNATDRAQWDLHDDNPYLFSDLVDAIRAKHNVDPRRIYLFGHSAGGVYAIMLGLLESEYFAGVAVHAGALPESSFDLIDYHDRKIPMAIWVGTNDRFFPVPLVEATRTALQARGIPVELDVMKNHTHDYYGRARDINPAAWAFLQTHRLSQDPKFKQYALK